MFVKTTNNISCEHSHKIYLHPPSVKEKRMDTVALREKDTIYRTFYVVDGCGSGNWEEEGWAIQISSNFNTISRSEGNNLPQLYDSTSSLSLLRLAMSSKLPVLVSQLSIDAAANHIDISLLKTKDNHAGYIFQNTCMDCLSTPLNTG
ncbi:hypothetical protein A4A49_35819 [Nicotiana attenuata]|uniref:Uncharacterized protein n=1 Tax=Nicotiana attenuata TaxID=49451 RepID=A0A1J6J0Q5_NICAT|nr:hypothetical protein A4A49_35819 [Nicotiana attenuata]